MISYYSVLLLTVASVSNSLTIIDPEIPYVTQLGSGLKVGDQISIIGRFQNAAYNVALNLNKGFDGYNGTVVLHFNIRFYEPNGVVLDTFQRGWQKAERPSAPFPFTKGSLFQIQLSCGNDSFDISVDGKPYYQFKYRSIPLSEANVLEILQKGEIEIYNISLNKCNT